MTCGGWEAPRKRRTISMSHFILVTFASTRLPCGPCFCPARAPVRSPRRRRCARIFFPKTQPSGWVGGRVVGRLSGRRGWRLQVCHLQLTAPLRSTPRRRSRSLSLSLVRAVFASLLSAARPPRHQRCCAIITENSWHGYKFNKVHFITRLFMSGASCLRCFEMREKLRRRASEPHALAAPGLWSSAKRWAIFGHTIVCVCLILLRVSVYACLCESEFFRLAECEPWVCWVEMIFQIPVGGHRWYVLT